MAKGLNKVLLIGRLGADPELKYTPQGTAITTLNLATSRPVKKGDQWGEETDWHRIVVWGKLAENCNQYLSKGSKVFIEGTLQTRKWQDKEGNNRYTTEVIARDIVFLDDKGQSTTTQTPEDDVPF